MVAYFMIGKFQFATPGRLGNYTEEGGEEETAGPAASGGGAKSGGQAERIIALLGGRENITLVDACMTRLRVTVKDPAKVADLAEWKAEGALALRPDLIALQEVDQLQAAAPIDAGDGYVPAPGAVPLRQGNYAWEAARLLRAAGVPCSWTWLPVKLGYERYDEGLAVLSLSRPIAETEALLVSAQDNYADWRTRKVLGVRLEGLADWFYSVHLGWWEDEDPFRDQWARLEAGLAEKRAQGPVWLLGDFNAPAHVQGQSFDLVRRSGWQDTYQLAQVREGGATVQGPIDGWPDQAEGLRIDYIWRSEALPITRSQVVLDGTSGPAVSDHFGVLAETEGAL